MKDDFFLLQTWSFRTNFLTCICLRRSVEKRKVATSWRHRIRYWFVYDVTWCLSSGIYSKL